MTKLPLYKSAKQPDKSTFSDAHLGLWFDRFFDRYDNDFQVAKTGKQEWINLFTSNQCGNKEKLDLAREQRIQLVNRLVGCYEFVLSDWRFVSGLGLPHPVENGFIWHPTLAVPYLTGAAVKGLLRAWIESGWGPELKDKEYAAWFGEEGDEGSPKAAGGIIFFDAIPIQPVTLVADVMTPHLGEWYARGRDLDKLDESSDLAASIIPGDWHDPVPIPFLAVENITLLVAIAPRPGTVKSEPTQQAMKELLVALNEMGAGAKTATGYGRFSSNKARLKNTAGLWGNVDLARKFGKNFDKTKAYYGGQFPMIVQFVKELHGELLESWRALDNKQENKNKLKTANNIQEYISNKQK